MIYFSLTGIMPKMNLSNAYVNLNGKKVAVLYPTLRAGEVASIAGIDELKHNEKVISYSSRYLPGDSVEFTNTTRQRLAEIDILGEKVIRMIYENDLRDDQGELFGFGFGNKEDTGKY